VYVDTLLRLIERVERGTARVFPKIDKRLLLEGETIHVNEATSTVIKQGKYNGEDVAVKVIEVCFMPHLKYLRRVVAIMSLVKHPNVISLKAAKVRNPNAVDKPGPAAILIMPLMELGSLKLLIENGFIQKWDRNTLLFIAKDIAEGMKYLSRCGILHRNLNNSSILLTEKGGLSAKISEYEASRLSILSVKPNSDSYRAQKYAAPELLSAKRYGSEVDVYSYGILLWELLHKKFAFTDIPVEIDFMSGISDGRIKRPPIDPSIPVEYATLIEKCWSINPLERPTFLEICKILPERRNF